MAPKKPNKHTLETYYSEWDITMAGSITAGIMLKIYSLLKDKENNKSKFSVRSHINKVISMWFKKATTGFKWEQASSYKQKVSPLDFNS